jgi:2-oxo-4-hydroxy-4-carboxy-5-ureidoimidazoline decarboxylase
MPPPPTTLDVLNRAEKDSFVNLLGDIFEESPWVAERASASRPFATITQLHDALMAVVRARPISEQIAFISAHPDLAGKAARAGAIAPASISEQAGLGIDQLTEAEFDRFEELNAAYRARFNFPFVICVRRQTRDAILAAFAQRLDHDVRTEVETALDEIGYITRLRLVDRVEGVGAPAVTGRLSTHVLDTYHGRPAKGVMMELFEVGQSARAQLVSTRTNAEGRTDQPLIAGCPLRIGAYELVFHVKLYFEANGVKLPDWPFLDIVSIRFGISEPEGHYHVPLVMSPWSYSTYRGG